MRRIIICCDGTWNTAGQTSEGDVVRATNVAKFAHCVAPHDGGGHAQIVYYQRGLGTGNIVDRIAGGAFGDGLLQVVEDCYRFLIENYAEGDEIWLLGFSRGAFTARTLEGLLRHAGILAKRFADQAGPAIALYRRRDQLGETEEARQFRSKYARRLRYFEDNKYAVPIKFLGVWDTVGSLGVPVGPIRWLFRHRYQFHDQRLSRYVANAFHALAIDEHRWQFRPALWTQDKCAERQIVSQTWFVGAHSDVGGGYDDDRLSDCSLYWMLENAVRRGLAVDTSNVQISPDSVKPKVHDSRLGPYRLTRGYERPIGSGGLGQSIHPSALARFALRPDYRPANLTRYLVDNDELAPLLSSPPKVPLYPPLDTAQKQLTSG